VSPCFCILCAYKDAHARGQSFIAKYSKCNRDLRVGVESHMQVVVVRGVVQHLENSGTFFSRNASKEHADRKMTRMEEKSHHHIRCNSRVVKSLYEERGEERD